MKRSCPANKEGAGISGSETLGSKDINSCLGKKWAEAARAKVHGWGTPEAEAGEMGWGQTAPAL